MSDLPETLLEGFRCIECEKYLRPPIWIVCKSGHKVCDLCKEKVVTCKPCPDSDGFCKVTDEKIRDIALENTIKDLDLPISCKHHGDECDFSGNLASVIEHEEDCPFRFVECAVFHCDEDIKFNLIEDHMMKEHQDLIDGEWDIVPGIDHDDNSFALKDSSWASKTWRYRGVRFIATLISGRHSLWHLYVMAVCGRNESSKFRAEIRLSSNLVPECNDVFYRPVLHIESPVKWDYNDSKMSEYTSILHLPAKVVCKHSKEAEEEGEELQIPFTIKIFEKVFPAADKADIDENANTDQDMEDGK